MQAYNFQNDDNILERLLSLNLALVKQEKQLIIDN